MQGEVELKCVVIGSTNSGSKVDLQEVICLTLTVIIFMTVLIEIGLLKPTFILFYTIFIILYWIL